MPLRQSHVVFEFSEPVHRRREVTINGHKAGSRLLKNYVNRLNPLCRKHLFSRALSCLCTSLLPDIAESQMNLSCCRHENLLWRPVAWIVRNSAIPCVVGWNLWSFYW